MKRKRKGIGVLLGAMLGVFGLLGPLDLFSPGGATSKWLMSGTAFAQGVSNNRGTSASTGTANPVPLINQPLVPDATAPGGPDFTLTVNGTGFVSGSVVNWNGSPLATTFISGSQLKAAVPAADVAIATTASVTVINPTPGGGTSNLMFFTATADTGDAIAFTLASSPPVGWLCDSTVVGDFNGDDKLDLAVTNFDSETVSVLLGDGTGNFILASSPATGPSPGSVAVGDVNGDGKLDLVTANTDGNTVSVLLGDGTGNFSLASSPATGLWPHSVAVGDFNRDGKLDLAVANWGDQTVWILLGDGTGNFGLASSPATGANPASVAVGDFNGDGKLDLAVVNEWSYTISVLLGDGAGDFSLSSSPATGANPLSVAVADFNGDGTLDLVVANYDSNTVSILLGDGTGNFTLASSPAAGQEPISVAVGDFNGDGKLDVAVANSGSSTVSILLGDGTGNLTLASSPATGQSQSVAVGDFNGDGKLDIAVANWGSSTVSILLQNPPGPAVTLSPASLDFGTQLIFVASARRAVTLSYTGARSLDITNIIASDSFSQMNNCGSRVPAGGKCTIGVFFRPHALGTVTGTITITDNAFDSPQTVSLTGAGTFVGLSPARLDFGSQPVGTTSSPQTVVLTNHSRGALSIFQIRFTGTGQKEFAQTNACGSSVAAGSSCTFSVTFTPSAAGSRTATLNVGDNGGGSPQTVALSGTGT